MTFLSLVQELHEICGASGQPPVSTVGQSGEARRLVRFVGNADYNWQARWLNWHFLFARTGVDFRLVPNDTTPPPTDLFTWDSATFHVKQQDGSDWIPVGVRDYSVVKTEVPVTDTGLPFEASILPGRRLQFNPIPDRAYLFRSDYYRKPVRLVESGDVSPIPEEYHSTVVIGTALMYYADFEDAPEQRRQAMELIEQGRPQLEAHEMPNNMAEWFMGQPFAVGPDRF